MNHHRELTRNVPLESTFDYTCYGAPRPKSKIEFNVSIRLFQRKKKIQEFFDCTHVIHGSYNFRQKIQGLFNDKKRRFRSKNRNSLSTFSYTQFTDVIATSFRILFLEVRKQILYSTIISLIRKVVGRK